MLHFHLPRARPPDGVAQAKTWGQVGSGRSGIFPSSFPRHRSASASVGIPRPTSPGGPVPSPQHPGPQARREKGAEPSPSLKLGEGARRGLVSLPGPLRSGSTGALGGERCGAACLGGEADLVQAAASCPGLTAPLLPASASSLASCQPGGADGSPCRDCSRFI